VLQQQPDGPLQIQHRSKSKIKSKAVPLLHAGAKGNGKFSSYSFFTLVLDRGERSASHTYLSIRITRDPYSLYSNEIMLIFLVSELALVTKVEISLNLRDLGDRRHFTALQTSELETYGKKY
jgi:hypothetical protein